MPIRARVATAGVLLAPNHLASNALPGTFLGVGSDGFVWSAPPPPTADELAPSPTLGNLLSVGANGMVWAPPQPSGRAISITLDATLPALAAQERGSCTVSLIGTALEFLVPGMPLLVDALEESMPPAINNGMYITCRVSAAAEVKLYFIGRITSKVLPYLFTTWV